MMPGGAGGPTGPGGAGPGSAASPRLLLRRLREILAAPGEGSERLKQIVNLIAVSMAAEVCSVYLRRDGETLELAATKGLRAEAVGIARLKFGDGLVGVIARDAEPINTAKANEHPEFRYLPETGEEMFSSFLGVPVQRLGKVLGVLVVQTARNTTYDEEEVDALSLVATVIAEMADAGVLAAEGLERGGRGDFPFHASGTGAADGVALGPAYLHEPRILLPNPIADDPATERKRLRAAMEGLQTDIDELVDRADATGEHRDIMETYRMVANDSGWMRRLEEAVATGLTAEAAVDKARSDARARFDRASDPYLRERLHDMEDLAQRLLRKLIGHGDAPPPAPGSIIVARDLGPGELMDYEAYAPSGVVLEGGSPSSHASIVARALAIPLVTQAKGIAREAEAGDLMIVNGDQGHVHLRPRADVITAYEEKLALREQEQAVFDALRDRPAITRCGARISLNMNAGIAADLPSLEESGADGIGLFRTELHYMLNSKMPTREDQTAFYRHVLNKANGRRVLFRTLDVGSDKVLSYLKQPKEDNPALGWRAIRIALDRPSVLKMQAQALIRAANGRPLSVMFPLVADVREFERAREILLEEAERAALIDSVAPESLDIGAMLETPSLAFAPDRFFALADFISIGGNDLAQFFFAADRMNELTAGRYNATHPAFLALLRMIVERCAKANTPLSFCGEAAGRPLDALVLATVGLRSLSMRPAAVGPVKRALVNADLGEIAAAIAKAERDGTPVREAVVAVMQEYQVA